jgi:ketol-acid reductoisomerase
MVKTYYEQDGNIALLKGKNVGISWPWSQGYAHALNLRDSGVSVVIGLRKPARAGPRRNRPVFACCPCGGGPGRERHDGPGAGSHPAGFMKELKPYLTAGKTLMFAHGFAIHFGFIQPPQDIDVSMIALRRPAIACARCSRTAWACRRWCRASGTFREGA